MEEFSELTHLDQNFADRVLHFTNLAGDADLKHLLAMTMAAARTGDLCLSEKQTAGSIQNGLEKLERFATLLSPFLRRESDKVYLEKNWAIEKSIIQDVLRLSQSRHDKQFCAALPMNTEQENAVKKALSHRLTLLTGGPGTGKTYTAAAIVEAMLAGGKHRIYLTAPTGRAADHLSKSIEKHCGVKFESGTLHKLLKLGRMPPNLKASFILDADLIIVDESSMIDAPLFATLLKAIPDTCSTVLMGDPNQLSPVGIGSIFSDLVKSTKLPVAKAQLQFSMRTDNKEILTLANDILLGIMNSSFLTLWPEKQVDLFTILKSFMKPWANNSSSTLPKAEELFKLLSSTRLLNSLKQGPFGADAINQWFLEETQENTPSGWWWWAPLIICRNDEKHALSNGEVGIYMQKKGDPATGVAYFPDRQDPIPEIALPLWEYAFCTSVHKAQGSEYDEVLALFPIGSEHFGREMLYTSVTRAKKRVFLLGDMSTIEAMLKKSLKKQSGIE